MSRTLSALAGLLGLSLTGGCGGEQASDGATAEESPGVEAEDECFSEFARGGSWPAGCLPAELERALGTARRMPTSQIAFENLARGLLPPGSEVSSSEVELTADCEDEPFESWMTSPSGTRTEWIGTCGAVCGSVEVHGCETRWIVQPFNTSKTRRSVHARLDQPKRGRALTLESGASAFVEDYKEQSVRWLTAELELDMARGSFPAGEYRVRQDMFRDDWLYVSAEDWSVEGHVDGQELEVETWNDFQSEFRTRGLALHVGGPAGVSCDYREEWSSWLGQTDGVTVTLTISDGADSSTQTFSE